MKCIIRLFSLFMAIFLIFICIFIKSSAVYAFSLKENASAWVEKGRSLVFCNFIRTATCSQIKSLFTDTPLDVYSSDNVKYTGESFAGTGSVIKSLDPSDGLTVVLFGDINGDGVIDALDAMLIDLAGSGNLSLTGASREAADLTRDGYITAADVAGASDLSVDREVDIGLKAQSSHTVSFLDWNGTVLNSQTVPKNQSASLPASSPNRSGYIFTGWSGQLTKVTSNNTVTAMYLPSTVSNLFCLSWGNAASGQTVTLTLVLTGTVYMCGYQLEVKYDPDCLTYVSNTRGSSVMTNHIAASNSLRASYVNMSAVNETGSRTVLTVTFTVKNTTAASTPVTVNLSKVFDGNEALVDACAASGAVYIK